MDGAPSFLFCSLRAVSSGGPRRRPPGARVHWPSRADFALTVASLGAVRSAADRRSEQRAVRSGCHALLLRGRRGRGPSERRHPLRWRIFLSRRHYPRAFSYYLEIPRVQFSMVETIRADVAPVCAGFVYVAGVRKSSHV